jgi:hypothetical protein
MGQARKPTVFGAPYSVYVRSVRLYAARAGELGGRRFVSPWTARNRTPRPTGGDGAALCAAQATATVELRRAGLSPRVPIQPLRDRLQLTADLVPGKDLEYSGLDGAFLTHCRLRR